MGGHGPLHTIVLVGMAPEARLGDDGDALVATAMAKREVEMVGHETESS